MAGFLGPELSVAPRDGDLRALSGELVAFVNRLCEMPEVRFVASPLDLLPQASVTPDPLGKACRRAGGDLALAAMARAGAAGPTLETLATGSHLVEGRSSGRDRPHRRHRHGAIVAVRRAHPGRGARDHATRDGGAGRPVVAGPARNEPAVGRRHGVSGHRAARRPAADRAGDPRSAAVPRRHSPDGVPHPRHARVHGAVPHHGTHRYGDDPGHRARPRRRRHSPPARSASGIAFAPARIPPARFRRRCFERDAPAASRRTYSLPASGR